MKEYRYGMRLRPFDIGCQPKDGFVRCEEGTIRYYNIIVYNRPLTGKEMGEYELDDLTDRICPAEEGYYQMFIYHGEASYNLYDKDGNLIAENLKEK